MGTAAHSFCCNSACAITPDSLGEMPDFLVMPISILSGMSTRADKDTWVSVGSLLRGIAWRLAAKRNCEGFDGANTHNAEGQSGTVTDALSTCRKSCSCPRQAPYSTAPRRYPLLSPPTTPAADERRPEEETPEASDAGRGQEALRGRVAHHRGGSSATHRKFISGSEGLPNARQSDCSPAQGLPSVPHLANRWRRSSSSAAV